ATGNFASSAGGGTYVVDGGDVTIHNSIVAGNGQRNGDDSDIAGAALNAARSFNIIGDASAAGGLIVGVNGNIVGNNGTGIRDVSTILDTDATNTGGIGTPTHALVPGSPALDSGSLALAVDLNGDPLPYDQRGVDRF